MQSAAEPGKKARPYHVEAVSRACDILAAFTSPFESLDLSTITKRAKINKPTVFRILSTLVEKGLVERIGSRSYRCRFQPFCTTRHRIGFARQSSVVPFQGAVMDNLIYAARSANVELYILNNEYSPRKALSNVDRFVEEGVELVIESQASAKVAAEVSRKLASANIPCIAIDIPHPNAFYFGADNYKAGRIAGQFLAKWALKNWSGNPEQIVLAGASASGASAEARMTGLHDGILKAAPSLRHVPVFSYDTRGQFEFTLDLMRRHIRRSPARQVLVGAVNDVAALGALQAFRDLGREESVAVAGQGASLEARQELRRAHTGFICSVAYFPERYGERVISLALDVLNGRNAPPATFTEHQLVTAATVDEIYPNDALLKAH